jgi:hypothetical protein
VLWPKAEAAAIDARAVAEGIRGRLTLGFHGPGADAAAPLLEAVKSQLPDMRINLRRIDFTTRAGVLAATSDLGLAGRAAPPP